MISQREGYTIGFQAATVRHHLFNKIHDNGQTTEPDLFNSNGFQAATLAV
jgi:hypothetical protein